MNVFLCVRTADCTLISVTTAMFSCLLLQGGISAAGYNMAVMAHTWDPGLINTGEEKRGRHLTLDFGNT